MMTTTTVTTEHGRLRWADTHTHTHVVICDDYAIRCRSEDAAIRRRAQIEAAGACHLEHTIEPYDPTNPRHKKAQ